MKLDRHQRMMSHVNRWGIAPRGTEQSIADHSYYVTLYTMWLFKSHVQYASFELGEALEYALLHDVAEIRTGDMPGPVKHQVCELDALKDFETNVLRDVFDHEPYQSRAVEKLVKVADMIDEVMWVSWQIAMGNTLLRTQLNNSMRRFGEAVQAFDDFISRAAVETAVTEEVEAILHGNFQLPTPRHWTTPASKSASSADDEIPF